MAQENLIRASQISSTIVRATQFFEFIGAIAQSAIVGQTVRLPPALFQPIGSEDVADILADITVETPVYGMIEIAGPQRVRLDELVRRFLAATGDPHAVVTDGHARYFGLTVDDQSLNPGSNARIGLTSFETWLTSFPRK